VHDANRLGSNLLLEALVFVWHSSEKIKKELNAIHHERDVPDWDDSSTSNPEEWILVAHNKKETQAIMND
jgi:L-aspartate oxidase